jgi:hypothetical protein
VGHEELTSATRFSSAASRAWSASRQDDAAAALSLASRARVSASAASAAILRSDGATSKVVFPWAIHRSRDRRHISTSSAATTTAEMSRAISPEDRAMPLESFARRCSSPSAVSWASSAAPGTK